MKTCFFLRDIGRELVGKSSQAIALFSASNYTSTTPLTYKMCFGSLENLVGSDLHQPTQPFLGPELKQLRFFGAQAVCCG